MKTKIIAILLVLVILFTSCQKTPSSPYSRYESTFMDLFDTYSIIVGYAKSEQEFNGYAEIIYSKMKDLHQQYDIYNNYAGINNIKTINDNAGVAKVAVSDDIINLLIFSKKACNDTDGFVNVAMGSVLKIWHDYRTEGNNDPENAKLPPMELLKEAQKLTNIDNVIIDEAEKTVFLAKKGMNLDVGAIAKGYATQVATDTAKQAGMTSALVSIGGNICSVGKPEDGIRARWGIGIQDPKLDVGNTQEPIDTVFTNDTSVVTSGDYQRAYEVDGKIYNHIIDKDTLMPADRYASVTIICKDSGLGDVLSTGVYVLPVEDGKRLLKKLGAEAMWIHFDDTIEATDGYKKISKKLGNYSAVDK